VADETLTLQHGAASFPLPRGLAETAKAAAEAVVTLPDGSPLPRWIRYDSARRVFLVSTVQAGALPLQVLVLIRDQRTVLSISEKSRPASAR